MNFDEAIGGTIWNALFYLVSIVVPIIASLIAGYFSLRANRQSRDAAAAAALQEKQRHAEIEQETQRHRQQAEFYEDLLQEVKKLRNDNGDLIVRVKQLEEEVRSFEQKLEYYEQNPANSYARDLLESIFDAMAMPAWVHDISNSHWYVNRAYCDLFGVPDRKSFWQPINIYGRYSADAAVKYASHDLQIVETNQPDEFDEATPRQIINPDCEDFVRVRIRKTPIFIKNRPFIFGKVVAVLPDE